METFIAPYQLNLDVSTFAEIQSIHHQKRFLGDMQNYFNDQQSIQAILVNENPLIYEYWEIQNDGSSMISMSMTKIASGVVGDEFYMTKGHFHTLEEDGEEIYIVLQGQGYLLLQNRNSETQVLELIPNHLYYSPKGWAHRTVNRGEDELIFLTLWPNAVGHDYQSIERGGFPQLVVKGYPDPEIRQNPRYQSYQAIMESRDKNQLSAGM